MTSEQIIKAAIEQSISHNEIVCVTVDAYPDELGGLIDATQSTDWDSNDENDDDVGRPVRDVYSLDESLDQWRIRVTFAQEHPEGCSCGSPDCPEWQADQECI